MSYWAKKIGDIHISGKDGSTLCNRPMLGNNYFSQALLLHVPICQECLNKEKKNG